MDLWLKIIGVLLTAVSVTAAVYNIVTARGYQKQVAQGVKIDEALAIGHRNEQSIQHLEKRMDEREERTEKRLDQIGKDVAEVKKLFTDYIIESLKSLIPK